MDSDLQVKAEAAIAHQQRGGSIAALCRDEGWDYNSVKSAKNRLEKERDNEQSRYYVRGRSVNYGRGGEAGGVILNEWVKTDAIKEQRAQIIERIAANLKSSITPRQKLIDIPFSSTDSDLLTVYPIADLHLGLYASERETGEGWDIERATSVLQAAIDALTYAVPATKEALIINLGDFFHSDNTTNRTMKSGHALDVDGRYFDILERGVQLMIYTIDRVLEKHQRVTVWNRIGNHDEHSAHMLGLVLQAYYTREKRVTVDVNPSPADYMEWGGVMIGATHGDTYKVNKLHGIVAASQPEMWGRTTAHRVMFVGHIHQRLVQENHGLMVEVCRTIAAKDAWHNAQGYDRGRDMQAIVFSHSGESLRVTRNANDLMRLISKAKSKKKRKAA